jgi:hypothetical protein
MVMMFDVPRNFTFFEVLDGLGHDEERRPEIDGNMFVEQLRRCVGHAAPGCQARSIDHSIETAEVLDGSDDRAACLLRVPEVCLQEYRRHAESGEVLGDFPAGRRGASGDGDARSSLGRGLPRNPGAEALRAPADQYDGVLEQP